MGILYKLTQQEIFKLEYHIFDNGNYIFISIILFIFYAIYQFILLWTLRSILLTFIFMKYTNNHMQIHDKPIYTTGGICVHWTKMQGQIYPE